MGIVVKYMMILGENKSIVLLTGLCTLAYFQCLNMLQSFFILFVSFCSSNGSTCSALNFGFSLLLMNSITLAVLPIRTGLHLQFLQVT